jgi:hypothetical protein
MNKLVAVTLLLLVTPVHADELRIVETDEGIIAEYTGTPSEKGSDSEKPAISGKTANVSRVEYLTFQIERLKKETVEISRQSDNETEDDLKTRQVLADEKKRQIEMYSEEIRLLRDEPQPKKTDNTLADEGVPIKQQSNRKQMKRQMKELKKLRTSSSSATDPE